MNRAACAIATALLLVGCASSPERRSPTAVSATILDPARFIAEQGPWSFRGNPGREYRTPSAIVRTTTTDRIIQRRLPTFVERSVIHYQHGIVNLPAPPAPIETYLMGTRLQWEQLTTDLLGERAGVYLRIERGGFAAAQRGVFYDIGPRDTFVICAHEGWHQYAHSVLRDPLPVWLDEGIACYMEGFRWDNAAPDHPRFAPWANTERYDQLRRAASNNRLMPLHAILASRPQDLIARNASGDELLTWYAQSWALVHFLYSADGSRYRQAIQQILLDAAGGTLYQHIDDTLGEGKSRTLRVRRTGSELLAAYLPEQTLRELDADYQRFIEQITRPGGRDAVVAGRSPEH